MKPENHFYEFCGWFCCRWSVGSILTKCAPNFSVGKRKGHGSCFNNSLFLKPNRERKNEWMECFFTKYLKMEYTQKKQPCPRNTHFHKWCVSPKLKSIKKGTRRGTWRGEQRFIKQGGCAKPTTLMLSLPVDTEYNHRTKSTRIFPAAMGGSWPLLH